MIDNDGLKAFNERALAQLAKMCDDFDCADVDCSVCPFRLVSAYKFTADGRGYVCAFGYAHELHRRLTA